MKPVELFARAIRNSSLADEIVHDPFLGSGTTLIAAEQLGRICYGCEISEGYAGVILERAAGLGLEPRLIEVVGVAE
jgi:site-specific DNA-methyltransferase (adenine-specific)